MKASKFTDAQKAFIIQQIVVQFLAHGPRSPFFSAWTGGRYTEDRILSKRPPKRDLDVYPYLPRANVGTTSAASCMSLLAGMWHDRHLEDPPRRSSEDAQVTHLPAGI